MAIGETAALVASLELKDKFSKGISGAERSLGHLEGRLGRMGRGVGQVGSGLARVGTIAATAVVGGLTAVVTTAASFEQAEAGIRKTVSGTTDEVDTLVESIKNLSREVPLSFEELAAIAAEGGALGISTKGLANFTEIVARLGVSTDLTTEQAATALGQLTNVLHLSETDLQDVGDALVALGNDGASTESQILDLTARFGAAGYQAGLSNAEILALSSTVASMGIEAEAGGGALSRVFNNITTNIGTANKKADVLAETMGLSLAELRTAWDEDAGAVFRELLGHINELDKFESAELLKGLGITNVRDVNAIQLLAAGVDEYGRQLGVAEGQTDELTRESDVFFNTTEGKWKTLINNVRLAGDSIGNELLPVVNDLADDFVGWLRDPATQQGIKTFGTDLAAGVRGLIGELKGTDFSGIIDGMKLAATVAKGAFDAFNALPGPVKQLAIAALVANKVSGGAVGQIAKGLGNIGAGLFGPGGRKGGVAGLLGGRGSTPANPLFVSVVGPGGLGGGGKGGLPVGGAPAAGAAAGGGALAGALALGGGILLPFAMFNVIPELFKGAPGAGAQTVERKNEQGKTIVSLDQQTTAMFQGMIPSFTTTVERTGGTIGSELDDLYALTDSSLSDVRDETRELHNPLGAIREINHRSALGIETTRDEVRTLQGITQATVREAAAANAKASEQINAIRTTAANTATQLARVEAVERATAAATQQVANKDFSPRFNNVTNVGINASFVISATSVSRSLQIQQSASQTSFSGRGGDSRF